MNHLFDSEGNMSSITMYAQFTLFVVLVGCAPMQPTQQTMDATSPRVSIIGTFSPEEYQRIGVYFENSRNRLLHENDKRAIEDEFMCVIIEKGYILAARSDMETIKKEIDVQHSSLMEKTLARRGKALNVNAIFIISVTDCTQAPYTPPPPSIGAALENSVISSLSGEHRTSSKRTGQKLLSVNISARLLSAEQAQVVLLSSFTEKYVIDRDGIQVPLRHAASVVASGLPPRLRSN
jgi:hypothetical protein